MTRIVRATCLLAALLAAGTATTLHAQGILPIAVEGRAGLALPQGDWNEGDGLETGFGYGLNLRLQLMPLISVYGGWDRYSFGIEDMEDVDAVDTGMQLGAQLSLPLSMITGVSPFAFAGLVYNSTTLGFDDGTTSIEAKSDDAVGYEVGAGLSFPFAPTLSLTPAVRYRSHSADFSVGGEEFDTTVSYISFDVGLKLGI